LKTAAAISAFRLPFSSVVHNGCEQQTPATFAVLHVGRRWPLQQTYHVGKFCRVLLFLPNGVLRNTRALDERDPGSSTAAGTSVYSHSDTLFLACEQLLGSSCVFSYVFLFFLFSDMQL